MDDDAALEAAAEFHKRVQHCGGERVAVALELNKSLRLSTTVGRNSTSGDAGINLRGNLRKVLKNDSF
ncbi:hypothetical protein [Rhizobium leguminosarum]|uniref:hypothetical protein n=1 Tax=Rhizobium leguminosarum TaxID=384 RepID=UPI00103EB85B|nr:hypothetical protein [Rhizobium leguminosarum]TBZ57971.1 hypothetical protein E0H48_16020 [Rhizobium leguminosarum bv. viciae]